MLFDPVLSYQTSPLAQLNKSHNGRSQFKVQIFSIEVAAACKEVALEGNLQMQMSN